jgi:hypothetical protein
MMDIKRRISLFFSNLSTSFSLFFSKINVQLTFSSGKERNLLSILPVFGYVIVILSLRDFAYTLFPLQLQNPEWELKTISTLTEQVWPFLIGLGFVFTRYFYENQEDVRSLEIFFLQFIRWLLLIIGIISFLVIPLVFLDTNRLLTFFNAQINQQKDNALGEIIQAENRLAKVSSPDELRFFAKSLKLNPEVLSLPAPELQNILKTNLNSTKTKIIQQVAQKQQEQTTNLWKGSIRTIIGLIFNGVTFVFVWLRIGRAFK